MGRVLAWGAVIIGLWLVISPWFLKYQASSSLWGDVITGIIVAVLALIIILSKEGKTPTWPHWLNGILGLWLIASGIWISGRTGGNQWNEIVVGIVLALFSFSASQFREGLSLRMYDKGGNTLVEVSKFERRGSDIVMRGKIMGSIPTSIYVRPEEVWAMLGMMTIQIICSLPVFLVRGWQQSKKSVSRKDQPD